MLARYYEVLELQPGASREALTAAYRRAAMRWHPDRNPDDPEATERFQEIEHAYRTLLKLTPQAKWGAAAASAAAPPAAGGDDEEAYRQAERKWREIHSAARAHRARYAAQRAAAAEAREAEAAANSVKIRSPLFSLAALAAALLLWRALPPPLDMLAATGGVLLALLLRPQYAAHFAVRLFALLVQQGARLYFVALLGWFLWSMARRLAI